MKILVIILVFNRYVSDKLLSIMIIELIQFIFCRKSREHRFKHFLQRQTSQYITINSEFCDFLNIVSAKTQLRKWQSDSPHTFIEILRQDQFN